MGDTPEQHTIHIESVDRRITVEDGDTVLSALLENDIEWMHVCGQLCNCTTCAIKVTAGADNLSPMEEDEEVTLKRFQGPSILEKPIRLSCQARVRGPVRITEPELY